MNRVLLKLYLLTIKAAFRGLGRKFLTVRGAFLSVVTLGFFAVMSVQLIVMIAIRSRIPFVASDRFNLLGDYLPLGMLAYFLAGITPTLGERAIQFSPSEIDFLFPAPFTRRQLLGFYILRGFVAKLGLAIVVAIAISYLFPSILSAIVGIFLSLVFLHGATVAAQLVQQTIGTQFYSRARRILVTIVVLAVGIGIARALPTGVDAWTWLSEFRASTAVGIITAPFAVFSRVIVAPRLLEALPDLGIALVINVLVYWLVFSLDARYEDLAVRSSQRKYEQMQAAQRGSMYAAAYRRTEYTRSFVPQLPWWHGVGPNLRRQLLGGLRDLRGMLWLGLIIAGVFAGVMVFGLRENPKVVSYLGYIILGATAYVTFIFSAQLPFGFRGDLNHMEVLKTLPLRPIAIATAEVVGASIIGCLGQWFLVVVGILGAPSQSVILLTGAAFHVPFNLLLFGITNLLLLLFPFRLVSSSPDVTLMGRLMIMMMGNLFALLLGFGMAAIPAVIVFLLTRNWAAAFIVGWIGSMILGIGLLFGVAWAFQRFDVSTDMPD